MVPSSLSTLCPPAPPTARLPCTLGPQRPPSTDRLPPACPGAHPLVGFGWQRARAPTSGWVWLAACPGAHPLVGFGWQHARVPTSGWVWLAACPGAPTLWLGLAGGGSGRRSAGRGRERAGSVRSPSPRLRWAQPHLLAGPALPPRSLPCLVNCLNKPSGISPPECLLSGPSEQMFRWARMLVPSHMCFSSGVPSPSGKGRCCQALRPRQGTRRARPGALHS